MSYKIKISDSAKKELKKMDRYQANILIAWIEKNLAGSINPRLKGKALTGDKNEYYRYRVGNYRIITEILDNEVCILIIKIGHRRDVYE